MLEHIPDETTGEKFEDALFRVRRSVIGVGSGAPGEDDDDDDLVVSDVITVNLRCPVRVFPFGTVWFVLITMSAS